ncbi:recombinase family protein [Acidimangrovimonas pyrenivorans]|uniref:Recombinase family protein n=1 Tax=Acidimangrovimonas pyrenivorans TaxID=2030798 RepID=A0ABV7AN53_9RHOB
MTLRAAIYARYSSELQKPTSIDDQIAMAEKHCESKGWTVVARHFDAEMTGRNARRPGFQALLEDVRAGRLDVIVIESISRMSRRVTDSLTTFERLEFSKVTLVSLSEGVQTQLSVMMLGFAAQTQSEATAAQTERGRRSVLKKQHRLHSLAYGYSRKYVETGINREIDPEEAAIVRRIFEETAEGHASEAIAAGLNRDGIPSPTGGSWGGSTIRGNVTRGEGILRNTLYIGKARYGATHRENDPETGAKHVSTTPEKILEVEIPELRIIPQELWDAAQAQLDRSAKKVHAAGNPRAAHRNLYLLSGLLVCGCCGEPYVIRAQNRYGCKNFRKGICRDSKGIRRDRIEARVFNRLRHAFLTPELTESFEAAIRAERKKMRPTERDQTLKALRRHRGDLSRKLDNNFKAIEEGAPFKRLQPRIEALEAEIEALEARISETLAAQQAAAAPPPDPVIAYAEVLRRLEDLLGHPDFVDQAHQHLAALIQRIELRPDDTAQDGVAAEIHWGLGSLLSAGGYASHWANRFATNPQLTARSGAAPRPVAVVRIAPAP